jgi:hypothetical protein
MYEKNDLLELCHVESCASALHTQRDISPISICGDSATGLINKAVIITCKSELTTCDIERTTPAFCFPEGREV